MGNQPPQAKPKGFPTKTVILITILVIGVLGLGCWGIYEFFFKAHYSPETGEGLYHVKVEETNLKNGRIVVKNQLYCKDLVRAGKLFPKSKNSDILIAFQYKKPNDQALWGTNEDLSRLPTTYFHRGSPIGQVLSNLDWFPQSENTFHADARAPLSLVALSAPISPVPIPANTLVGLWAEPSICVVGLCGGTLASYARPYQHFHIFEEHTALKQYSDPSLPNPQFTFVKDAVARGAFVPIHYGEIRTALAQPYQNNGIFAEDKGCPENFYHILIVNTFSTEQVPPKIVSKEAIELYFDKVVEEGVVCFHTSNKYYDIPKFLADVAEANGLACRVSETDYQQFQSRKKQGKTYPYQFTSEWVLLARKRDYLDRWCRRKIHRLDNIVPIFQWRTPTSYGKYLWTDRKHNVSDIVRKNK